MPKTNKPKIVVIGGGTGSFTLLQAFKNHTDKLTALVSMADDGGSGGQLRDELGVLPPGDVRQCLVALSESSKLRDLFDYRFAEGSLKGHSLGNLFLSALERMTEDFSESVRLAGEMLRIKGAVLPVTTTETTLIARLASGKQISGEIKVAHYNFGRYLRPEILLKPVAVITPPARTAIKQADIVVIAPGNLYGSLAPALVVRGMQSALKSTKAKIVYVCNLVTKPGQTDSFKVHDYVAEIERFIGVPLIDYALYNTAKPPAKLLSKYTHEGEYLVDYDLAILAEQAYQAIGLPLIAKKAVKIRPGDALAHRRSLIRHDAEAVANELLKLTDNKHKIDK